MVRYLLILVVGWSLMFFLAPASAQVNKTPDKTTKGAPLKAGQKTQKKKVAVKRKVKRKSGHTTIKHRSEDDKKLEQVKAEKNRQKAGK